MRYPVRLAVVSLLLGSTGCFGRVLVGVSEPAPQRVVVVEDDGPWIVARTERRPGMHRYRYYEHDQVYYDMDTRVYYYQDNYEGPWITVNTLPSYVILENTYAVDLDMRANHPYEHHDAVMKSYPPGQQKRERKEDRGRGHGDGDGRDNNNGRGNGRGGWRRG